MPLRRIIIALLLLILLTAGVAFFFWDQLPYQNVAAQQIRKLLEGRGLIVENLDVKRLTGEEASLSTIRLGNPRTLSIEHLDATFAFKELAEGRFRTITANDISLQIYRKDGAWHVAGLEPLFAGPASSKPVSVSQFLPQKLSVKNASVDAVSGDYRVSANGIDLEILQNGANEWRGMLLVFSMGITGLPEEIPLLKLQGNFSMKGEKLHSDFEITDADRKWNGNLSFAAPVADVAKGEVTIKNLGFPWGGGTINAADIRIPLTRTSPVLIPIAFRDVDLMALIGSISGGKVKGSGKVSGVLPVVWHPDGHVTLQNGTADAAGGGVISVAPEMFAGQDSAKMQAVRDALKNFQYSTLKASFSSDAAEKTAIHLTVEGKNPDVFEGRPVKLNVNLTGDIVPLVRQSILPSSDPGQFLQEKK